MRPALRLKKVLLAMAGCVAVLGLLVVWDFSKWEPVPETVTSSSFVACGQGFELQPGYLAFDYGSRPGAEVPSGHTIFNVHSMEPGEPAPEMPDQIFNSWPAEIAELVVGDPYRDWLQSIDDVADLSLLGRGVVIGGVSYDAGCRVTVHLEAQRGRLDERAGDWAIVIYEARGGFGALSGDLDEWRSSGSTD